MTGVNNPNWHGGIRMNGPYVQVSSPEHPRSGDFGYVNCHLLVAERILGKFLPPDAVIHHVDENPSNNDPSNLVICQDRAYHNLLHQRIRSLRNCGHASWKKCRFCGNYDDTDNMVTYGKQSHHRDCNNAYQRRQRTRLYYARRDRDRQDNAMV